MKRIGVDFDNTLVCYDGLFHTAAIAQGVMPKSGPQDKKEVREWFVRHSKEDDFTLLQGYVYGPGLINAKPYPDALKRLAGWKEQGCDIVLVSHKTSVPYKGPRYDLRTAAREWLAVNGFLDSGLLTPENIYFEDTFDDKAKRIAWLGCTHFIDDMKQFLMHPFLPKGMGRWWFLPGGPVVQLEGLSVFSAWKDMADVI